MMQAVFATTSPAIVSCTPAWLIVAWVFGGATADRADS